METKRDIRRRVLTARDGWSETQRERSECLVTERILSHQWYYRADTILLFVSFGSELRTDMLLAQAWKDGKRVFVPRVEGDSLQFYRIDSMEDVGPGFKGIKEPLFCKDIFKYADILEDRVLMLMPGVAFDARRNRLGYGKGFYDRYLADKASMHTIAIGYACQMVEDIPAGPEDIRPCQVICI